MGEYSPSAVTFIPHPIDFQDPEHGDHILDFIAEEGNSEEYLSFDNGFLVHPRDASAFKQLIRRYSEQ